MISLFLSKFIVPWPSGTRWCWKAYRSTATTSSGLQRQLKCLALRELGTFGTPLGDVQSWPASMIKVDHITTHLLVVM